MNNPWESVTDQSFNNFNNSQNYAMSNLPQMQNQLQMSQQQLQDMQQQQQPEPYPTFQNQYGIGSQQAVAPQPQQQQQSQTAGNVANTLRGATPWSLTGEANSRG